MAKMTHYTPMPDGLAQELGAIPALVYGKIWRYCNNGRDRVCRASHDTIAKELNLGRNTVKRAIYLLIEEGYIYDKTPTLRNRPHLRYVTNKPLPVAMSAIESEIDQRVREMYEEGQWDRESHEDYEVAQKGQPVAEVSHEVAHREPVGGPERAGSGPESPTQWPTVGREDSNKRVIKRVEEGNPLSTSKGQGQEQEQATKKAGTNPTSYSLPRSLELTYDPDGTLVPIIDRLKSLTGQYFYHDEKTLETAKFIAEKEAQGQSLEYFLENVKPERVAKYASFPLDICKEWKPVFDNATHPYLEGI